MYITATDWSCGTSVVLSLYCNLLISCKMTPGASQFRWKKIHSQTNEKWRFWERIRRGLIGSITLILSFEEATVLSHISVEKMEGMREGRRKERRKEGRKKSTYRKYLIANLEREKSVMHVDKFYRVVDLLQARMLCKNLKLIEAIHSEWWNTSENFRWMIWITNTSLLDESRIS